MSRIPPSKRLSQMAEKLFDRSDGVDLTGQLARLGARKLLQERKHIRTTNLVERSFEEERRRAKVIPRFRGEKECLKLVFATLWRSSERWRRIRFSEHERLQLNWYREERRIQKDNSRQKKGDTVA